MQAVYLGRECKFCFSIEAKPENLFLFLFNELM